MSNLMEQEWSMMQQTLSWQDGLQLPDNFYCLLDEQPLYLIPERLLLDVLHDYEAKTLVVNPFCWFSSVPPHLIGMARLPFLEFFLQGCEIIWVGNSTTGSFIPFWIGQQYQEILLAMWRGKLSTKELPSDVRSILVLANVLVNHEVILMKREERAKTISEHKSSFVKGYAILRDLLNPFHIGALRKYYRRLIREGRFQLGDAQSSQRYVCYNESVAMFYHTQLAGIVSEVAGTSVKPSYVYVASYQSGAELPKHIDREQCEYTITFCIDYSPEPVNESTWPIYLETDEGVVTVFQAIGDALLFKGRQVPHYRNKLAADSTSTSIFFHYVREDFAGPLQ